MDRIARGVFAGMIIGLAGIISSYAPMAIAPFTFSIGILIVILNGLNLYTGKVGFLKNNFNSYCELIVMFLCNVFGAILMTFYYYFFPKTETLENILIYKNSLSPIQFFISSIFCGILIYTSVTLSKKSKNPEIISILAIGCFVIGKFSHCIADSFYLGIDGFSIRDIFCILFSAIGNGVGAKVMNFLDKE